MADTIIIVFQAIRSIVGMGLMACLVWKVNKIGNKMNNKNPDEPKKLSKFQIGRIQRSRKKALKDKSASRGF